MSARILKAGKLPADLLAVLLADLESSDPAVVVGPRVGEDAAVLSLGGGYLVAATDPITFASDDIGWYAVHVNANDVAACGATPRWFLATVLLPENSTDVLARRVLEQIHSTAESLNVSVVGGHTEITVGLDRPIVVGQMLGLANQQTLLKTGGARPGDVLLLSKSIALEGTALLAREKAESIREQLGDERLAEAQSLLHSPGISVVPEASLACGTDVVTAMHDPTEGGLVNSVLEMAEASGTGVRLYQDRIPIHPLCRSICAELRVDPLGLIASGALLMAVSADGVDDIMSVFDAASMALTIIGEVVNAEHGCTFVSEDGTVTDMPKFERDEIARILS
tara:strand:+ start:233 stop:1249 length:1017 start_codon:yes stop_codon:yes gene_type:complete